MFLVGVKSIRTVACWKLMEHSYMITAIFRAHLTYEVSIPLDNAVWYAAVKLAVLCTFSSEPPSRLRWILDILLWTAASHPVTTWSTGRVTPSNGDTVATDVLTNLSKIIREPGAPFPKHIPSLIARFMGPTWGQHGAHLGPTGPRWVPCWPHESCYLGWLISP